MQAGFALLDKISYEKLLSKGIEGCLSVVMPISSAPLMSFFAGFDSGEKSSYVKSSHNAKKGCRSFQVVKSIISLRISDIAHAPLL
jgi:hypothetical protein